MASQHPDIEKVLFTQEDIDGIVSRLGEQITRDYAGKDLVLIAVLRGAVVFMGDLMRKIELPTNIDFMAVSSYGDGVSLRVSCVSLRTWISTSVVATC